MPCAKCTKRLKISAFRPKSAYIREVADHNSDFGQPYRHIVQKYGSLKGQYALKSPEIEILKNVSPIVILF